MSPADLELEAFFDGFRTTAFRLETLPMYSDDEEDAELALFLAGQPLPERSVRTVPWLRRVADTTGAGKRWQRVHVVSLPLTDYLRFELEGYEANIDAGEDVRIASRDEHPELATLRQDFWLFDDDTPHEFAALMRYDDAGHLTSLEHTAEPAAVEECRRARSLAVSCSVPLRGFLARLGA